MVQELEIGMSDFRSNVSMSLAQEYVVTQQPAILGHCRQILRRMSSINLEEEAQDLAQQVSLMRGHE
jgi:hypothetical protein